MNDNRRTDGGVIVAIVLIALGAWLLFNRVFGDWFAPVREAVQFLGRLALPLALIGIGLIILFAVQGKLGSIDIRGRRLYRSRSERMVAGVIGGLSAAIGIDPTILRIAYAIFAIASGVGPAVVIYIIAAAVIPEEPVASPAPPVWPGDVTGRETVQTPPPPPPAPPAPPVGGTPSATEPPA